MRRWVIITGPLIAADVVIRHGPDSIIIFAREEIIRYRVGGRWPGEIEVYLVSEDVFSRGSSVAPFSTRALVDELDHDTGCSSVGLLLRRVHNTVAAASFRVRRGTIRCRDKRQLDTGATGGAIAVV